VALIYTERLGWLRGARFARRPGRRESWWLRNLFRND